MEIFLSTNIINGKQYIGQTRTNDKNYFGSGKLLIFALEKYGRQNFSRQTLEVIEDENLLDEREIYWINKFDAANNRNFYNIQEGGRGWSKKVLEDYWKNRHETEKTEILTILKDLIITEPLINKNWKRNHIITTVVELLQYDSDMIIMKWETIDIAAFNLKLSRQLLYRAAKHNRL